MAPRIGEGNMSPDEMAAAAKVATQLNELPEGGTVMIDRVVLQHPHTVEVGPRAAEIADDCVLGGTSKAAARRQLARMRASQNGAEAMSSDMPTGEVHGMNGYNHGQNGAPIEELLGGTAIYDTELMPSRGDILVDTQSKPFN